MAFLETMADTMAIFETWRSWKTKMSKSYTVIFNSDLKSVKSSRARQFQKIKQKANYCPSAVKLNTSHVFSKGK